MVKLPFNPLTLSAHDKVIYDAMASERKKQGAPFGGPYAALMNHPELCQKIEALGFYLKFKGHLPRDVYQFVVLAVAKETHSDFEWNDHVQHALSAGLPSDIIDKLKIDGLSGSSFPNPYDHVAEILSATLVWKSIPEKVQADAIKEYGMCGFIEIVVLSGFYQMFSAINQGFDVTE
jgi:4-carboxymuconolactone decarboxylase